MLRQHAVLILLLVATVLLVIATSVYPGGSLLDPKSTGFDWTENFISNLFSATAVNGEPSRSRLWAIPTMALHSVGYGVCFLGMSKKIPHRHTAIVLRVTGTANIGFSFLIASPLHDEMITVSSTLFLLALFYVTVAIFKTRLHLLKTGCVVCLLVFYYTLYLYGSGNWGQLAVMQKVALSASMLLILGLEYFSRRADFVPVN